MKKAAETIVFLGPRIAVQGCMQRANKLGFRVHHLHEIVPAADWPVPTDRDAVSSLRQNLSKIRQLVSKKRTVLLHPGVDPWADRHELPGVCDAVGLTYLGASARSIASFSSKLGLLVRAQEVSVPHLALSLDPLHNERELLGLIAEKELAFPIVLKSAFLGGDFKFLVLLNKEDIAAQLPVWLEQVRRKQSSAMFFAERYIEGGRLITAPFFVKKSGEVKLFPLVDTSLQTQSQKLIEICPAPSVSIEICAKLAQWTKNVAVASNYLGFGYCEYMVDTDRAFLIGGAARLNSGYQLWERIASIHTIDVLLESYSFQKKSRSEAPPSEAKAGVLARVYAQDPSTSFPQPGKVLNLQVPKDKPNATRFVFEFKKNEEVPSTHSGWIGALLSVGKTLEEAAQQGATAMQGIFIGGSLQTNLRFLQEMLEHSWVKAGHFHAGFVDEEFLPQTHPPEEARVAAWQACLKILPSLKQWKWTVQGAAIVAPTPLKPLRRFQKTRWGARALCRQDTPVLVLKLPQPRSGHLRVLAHVGNWSFILQARDTTQSVAPVVTALSTGIVRSILFPPWLRCSGA